MSNLSKDHTSIRVHAPPGGQSSNIFGTSEFEQSAANKKKQSESSIFGSAKDNAEPAPAKPNRNVGNNIFGTDREENNTKPGTLAGQYKQTQMKSNIFGNDEPASSRHVSDKNRSDIFGVGGNEDQNKRQTGVRRVGYNPINGEAYSAKDNVNSKPNEPEKQPEAENSNAQTAPTNSTENDNAQATPVNAAENGNTQVPPATNNENNSTQAPATNNAENGNGQKPVEKPDNTANGQKNVHTSVRVFHPPGGRSNGPLW